MKESFSFYGTLKDQNTLKVKFGIKAIDCVTGQLRGCLHKVQDSTEPTGAHTYPLLDTEGSGTVNAVLVVLGIDEIERQKIADIVQILTFDASIINRDERDKEEVDKAINFGKDAVVIKAADFIDNSYFYHLTENELHKHLIDKFKYFLESSKPIIGKEEIYERLTERFSEFTHD
ncbi:MAG: hypothetical protein Q8Q30_01310 [Candidatus Woesebacteria bacterium]|nr:hypothetical protein [Candidatus Woesebacteria bacterium]